MSEAVKVDHLEVSKPIVFHHLQQRYPCRSYCGMNESQRQRPVYEIAQQSCNDPVMTEKHQRFIICSFDSIQVSFLYVAIRRQYLVKAR